MISIATGLAGPGIISSLNRCLERQRETVPFCVELLKCPEMEATFGSLKKGNVFSMKSDSRMLVASQHKINSCLAKSTAFALVNPRPRFLPFERTSTPVIDAILCVLSEDPSSITKTSSGGIDCANKDLTEASTVSGLL